MRQQGAAGLFGVMRLHSQEDAVPSTRHFAGEECRRLNRELLDRTENMQAVIADGGDMVGNDVHECNVVSGPLEIGADHAANRAGTPNQNTLAHQLCSWMCGIRLSAQAAAGKTP